MNTYKFIESPKDILEVKVNLERAINDLKNYYSERFYQKLHDEGCAAADNAYKNMHMMEAIHNIKLSLLDD